MPELDFKGKEFVRNHHLTVPYRPLVPHADKSVGDVDLSGNLIIHGDNLNALKALLPMYAGKVDCIFIDPPYNTGNEDWRYNDNVNSTVLREWFKENPVGIDDTLRHDKWCAMMWPRLKLLHELLSETGSFWMTLDDNEVHRARVMLDEIFGQENFIANIVWQKKYATSNDAKGISAMHDHILCYSKSEEFSRNLLPRTESANAHYKNDDGDGRGPWRSDNILVKTFSPNSIFEIVNPNTNRSYYPPEGSSWRVNKQKAELWLEEGRIFFGKDGTGAPQLKRYLNEVLQGSVPSTWWSFSDAGHNDMAAKELAMIMEEPKPFDTPKPLMLIERILTIATNSDSIVLDSFAGSGTTAHAVLSLNKKDNGRRKFILAEVLNYAETLTAKRVLKAITGYPYKTVISKVILERKLSKAVIMDPDNDWLSEIRFVATTSVGQFERIRVDTDKGVVRVIGEDDIEEKMPGLGGSFTYCTLGEPLNLDQMLFTDNLPQRNSLGDWLLYLASGTHNRDAKPNKLGGLDDIFLAKQGNTYYWFIYQPDRKFLGGPEAALTLSLAEKIQAIDPKATHRVFSPAKYVSQKVIRDKGWNIEYAPIPMALFNRGI
jgi:adenine-specific DNA-methyltransferase